MTNKHDPFLIPGYQKGDSLNNKVGLGSGSEAFCRLPKAIYGFISRFP